MAVLLEDREVVRPFLSRDPVGNATVIHRVFHNPEFSLAVADQLPEPKAVLALKPSASGEEPHQFALAARDPLAALHVLRSVPKGACVFHVADALAFPAIRERIDVGWWGEANLYTVAPGDLRGAEAHEVRPLDAKFAAKVAKVWAPDWPAEAYVRSRIEAGRAGAVYEGGEPVAWALTHLETEEVVMMGFLHVLEPYRGRGYAKALTCHAAKEILAAGKVPAAHVYTDNAASVSLMEGLGFKAVCLQAWGDGVVRQ